MGEYERTSLHLIAHVGPQVLLNVNSGQINMQELLTSKLIRFWTIAIAANGVEPMRRVLYKPLDTLLKDVLAEVLGIDGPAATRWSISVCPSPKRELARLSDKDLTRNLCDVGVVFGSVLTLNRVDSHFLGIAATAASR